MRKSANAARAGRALTALASCWALPAVLEAQAPETLPAEPPALSTGLETSGLPTLRRGRDALIAVRDFDGALNPAQDIVDAQQERREPEYPADLAALGLIQGELRQTERAVGNLVDAIGLVETAEGEYSPTLIEYYRGLGRTYIKGGRYEQAIVTLEEAQHISQRHLGLFNVEQAPLLDDITTAYLGLGDTTAAQNMQIERLDNAVRRFGMGDPRVIPYRYTLAKYYERSRLPESAREQYQEVLEAQETQLGSSDPTLLAPLRWLVAIDLLVDQADDTEQRDRLVALLEQNQDASPIERGLSLALLGDWATVAGDAPAARSYYQQAWSTLHASPGLDVAALFGKPAMLDFVAPLSPVDRAERSRPYTWAEVVLEFNVSAEGLPSDVRVITRDPRITSLLARYSRRMRETHFRPRLVDGEPAATTSVRSTHYLRRYLNDEEEEELDP